MNNFIGLLILLVALTGACQPRVIKIEEPAAPPPETKTQETVITAAPAEPPTEEVRAVISHMGNPHWVVKRSQLETNRLYGYAYDRGTSVRIESVRAEPRAVRPGQMLRLQLTFLVFAHGQVEVPVEEVREIWTEGRLWESSAYTMARKGGTYTSSVPVKLPRDVDPGQYKVIFIVRTEESRDVRETVFKVSE